MMPDANHRFGRLLVIGSAEPKKASKRVLCLCDCGKEHIANINNLRSGATSSCGCLRNERIREANSRHSMTDSITHNRWKSMRSRCNQKNSKSYPRYGGRGITICEEWNDFEAFLRDMSECPGDGWTLERKDSDGNYEPSNCKWATRKEQNRNTSRTHLLEFRGESRCVGEWSEILGLDVQTILSRLRRGWDVDKSLGTPVEKRTAE